MLVNILILKKIQDLRPYEFIQFRGILKPSTHTE